MSYELFDTVFGLGEKSINRLIADHAKTIDDLKNKPRYNDTLTEPTRNYLKYYDDLQKRIPRQEVIRHEKKIDELINTGGNFYKIEIVGSFRRGESSCGDIDVLITTTNKLKYNPNIEYVRTITGILTTHGYIIQNLRNGGKVTNAIAKLTPNSTARRVDLFFSPPELYAFALLAKTGDIVFNKSLRSCIKEKNPDYSFSELGIRANGKNIGDINQFQSVDSILIFIGIGKREPREMVGNIPAGTCTKREFVDSQESPWLKDFSWDEGSQSESSDKSKRSTRKRKRSPSK